MTYWHVKVYDNFAKYRVWENAFFRFLLLWSYWIWWKVWQREIFNKHILHNIVLVRNTNICYRPLKNVINKKGSPSEVLLILFFFFGDLYCIKGFYISVCKTLFPIKNVCKLRPSRFDSFFTILSQIQSRGQKKMLIISAIFCSIYIHKRGKSTRRDVTSLRKFIDCWDATRQS